MTCTSEKTLLTHDLSSTHTMSAHQKNVVDAHDEVANDLHAQYQLHIEALKAEHNTEKTALLEEIQAAETRYQELKSKHQEDVDRLNGELAKHSSKFDHDQDATTVSDNNVESNIENILGKDEKAVEFASRDFLDGCNLTYDLETAEMQQILRRTAYPKMRLMQRTWKEWEHRFKNKEDYERAFQARWKRELARISSWKAC